MPKRSRLSIDLPRKTLDELRATIPRGHRNELFAVITNDLLQLIKERGLEILTLVLQRKLRLQELETLREVLPEQQEAEHICVCENPVEDVSENCMLCDKYVTRS